MAEFICLFCRKTASGRPSLIKRNKRFCSLRCKTRFFKGKHLSLATEFKKGAIPWNKGKSNIYSKEFSERLSTYNKIGRIGMLGRKHSDLARRKIGKANSGEKSNFWKGGVTQPNEKLRRSIEYKLWRTAVFMRDDYTCQICRSRGIKLHADHIKPWASYPELRFAIDNGRTLCVECHKETPTYLNNRFEIYANI